ncbi:hypothetical protein BGY98DRAFT_997830, partial [Russula aff. rugulosa BPL654]
MYLRTRSIFLAASLCLIIKLGCIALLLNLQAASSPSSRHCTIPLFFFWLKRKPRTHAGLWTPHAHAKIKIKKPT